MAGSIEMKKASNGHADDDDIEMGRTELPPEPVVGQGFLKPVPETTPIERLAAVIAGIAVIMALVAMIVKGGLIVVIGGLLSAVISPYSYYQQTLLTDIRTLKETKEELENQVNRLGASNEKLSKNIDTMTTSVERLGDVEAALKTITALQDQSIDGFRDQVKQAQDLLKDMQKNHKAAILQNLLTVVFRSDTDGDNAINEEELDDLMRRIENTTPDIVIHKDRFRKAVLGQPVGAVVGVIQNLLQDDVHPQERIFEFTDN